MEHYAYLHAYELPWCPSEAYANISNHLVIQDELLFHLKKA